MRSVLLALLFVVATAGSAVAVPPPPPNPSQSEIDAGKRAAKNKAGEVGRLTNQLAQAEARLMDLHAEVELRMEEANQALVDLESAREVAKKARADAAAASREADGAARVVDDARAELDEFAAGSYKQGSTVGSISAYVGAASPEDLLARAQLLDAVGGSHLDALARMERARTQKANKDSLARQALTQAEQAEDKAEEAKRDADSAMATASAARRDAESKTAELEAARADYERQLAAAQRRVGGLEAQRSRYNQWLADKRREEAAASTPRPQRPSARPPAGGSVRVVIDRALSQIGLPYAWGGGNAYGPTRGIRDGGVADSYGDYNKIGFDCSGLMIYAFAGVGIRLPHYSGYQATYGRKVSLNSMRPGDMLFWATRGRIHHVAMYIGNGQMVEAPFSGSRVRVTSVRWGGLVPYAVRLL
ncbi:NlpC/P60 family protein [Actinokineospora guangxiensis]|uniref:NlpC/P60 family protein n=1 Tax=Actinokineospora guangxiensis TaxID=1490288 RepID=A0ABW0ENJ9_9PSEU